MVGVTVWPPCRSRGHLRRARPALGHPTCDARHSRPAHLDSLSDTGTPHGRSWPRFRAGAGSGAPERSLPARPAHQALQRAKRVTERKSPEPSSRGRPGRGPETEDAPFCSGRGRPRGGNPAGGAHLAGIHLAAQVAGTHHAVGERVAIQAGAQRLVQQLHSGLLQHLWLDHCRGQGRPVGERSRAPGAPPPARSLQGHAPLRLSSPSGEQSGRLQQRPETGNQ